VVVLNEKELSTSAIHRLIQKGGAARIGDDAVEELRTILEDLAIRIGKESWELSIHAGRKTVRADDIKLAIKRIISL
jgi:histone H3/H4